MPLYVADYLSATEHLSAAESGAYLHLLMHYWMKGKLPTEDRFLARIARMTEREWGKAKGIIAAFFRPDWTHERVEKELEKARAKAEARSEAGSRGGKAKALKQRDVNSANATGLPEQKCDEALPSSQGLGLEKKDARERARLVQEKFENRFWAIWPNKVGKEAAIRAYCRVHGEAVAIEAGVHRYIRDKPPDRPWLNPATFLNQRRWEDAPAATGLKPSLTIEERAASVSGFYAKPDSEQLREWDEHKRATTGRPAPRDKDGGWCFPSEWPPVRYPAEQGALL